MLQSRLGVVQGDSGQIQRSQVFSFPRGKHYETLSDIFLGPSSTETGDEYFCSIIFYDNLILARLAGPGLSAAGNLST